MQKCLGFSFLLYIFIDLSDPHNAAPGFLLSINKPLVGINFCSCLFFNIEN